MSPYRLRPTALGYLVTDINGAPVVTRLFPGKRSAQRRLSRMLERLRERPYSCAKCEKRLPWTDDEGYRLMYLKGQEYLLCAGCQSEIDERNQEI